MREQLITLKTAKLAKEKNCKIETEIGYDLSGYLIKKRSLLFINAPTQSLLQKWLREIHNIHIYITPDYINGDALISDLLKEEELMIVKYDLSTVWEMILYDNYRQFDTYEEALETGLQEALKLIE